MKRFIVWLLLLSATALGADQRFSAGEFLAHVKYLASDELKGRGNNRPELEKAASYIEREFRRAGVQPFPSLGGYRQPFEITAEVEVDKASRLRLGSKTYRLPRDFSLFSFSEQPAGSAEAVFCGYGVVAPDAGYDDYAGKAVAGKVAVVLDGVPELPGGQRNSRLGGALSKIMTARHRGATALILLRSPAKVPSNAAERVGIPAFAVAPAVISALWGVSPEQLKDPHASLAPLQVSWDLKVRERRKTVSNVVAYVAPPEKPQEWIVLGAHYDHVGLGEKFALDPAAAGQPHNGADDNASGTAGVLSLARVLAADSSRFSRGVILVAFAAEEMGLLGSAHFVRNFPAEAQRVVAMVNLDMIGRAQGKIYINGTGSAREFGPLLAGLNPPLPIERPLKVETSQSSVAGSDHISFLQRGIPALFFFSGLHSDYHKATDDWQKINSESAVQVLELVRQVLEKLATSTGALQFVKVAEPQPAGGGSGYGAYFGSIPDFGQDAGGVRFSDVQPDSPAYKAGLRGGDILTKFDGKPIDNLYDFTFALRSHAPGETVEVEYIRGDATIKAKVTLGKRE
ncbi:MAG: M20/M25/M40 family metallo-hydrolase [Acidobacteria bacterium]|nr:M20/M25/M40 family metallo-hydrolase [Acidobacteriota bacterium]